MNTWTFAIVWVFAWAILGGLIIASIGTITAQRKRRRLIAAGLYPKPGSETDEDVQRLMGAGQQDMAIRCYRTVHRVSFQQAKDQLIGSKPAEYGLIPIGLIFGLSIGLGFRNTALGAGLGLILGVTLALLMRKRRTHDNGPQ